MSKKTAVTYLTLSGGIHMLAAVMVLFLVKTSEPIYENIDVMSYVGHSTNSHKSDSKTDSRAKTNQIKNDEFIDKTEQKTSDPKLIESSNTSTESFTDNLSQDLSEHLALDSAITSPAVLISKTKANRTEAARQADYSGVAQVELVIGSDGMVRAVKLRNNLPYGLNDIALQIAREAKFKPAMINNKPVASAILFKVRFESEK